MVAGARDDLAAAPETHRQRLILLARQALERALALDDAPVAVFVLEEEARDRDPAATLADGVLKAKARALRPPAEQPAEAAPRPLPLGPAAHHDAPRHRPPAPRHPGRGRHPPRGGAGRGRAAPHHRRGAQHALALKQGAERPILPLRHGLFVYADTGELVEIDPAPEEDQPRQAQAP